MSRTIEKLFRAPYGVPNALQVVEEGLWITDQITDRVALIEIAEPSEYGVTRLIRDIPSESSNTSGMAWGGGSLWLAATGRVRSGGPHGRRTLSKARARFSRSIRLPARPAIAIRCPVGAGFTGWSTIRLKRAMCGSPPSRARR